jgi:gluconokinase
LQSKERSKTPFFELTRTALSWVVSKNHTFLAMTQSLVIMGVSGCGKSSLGQAVASALAQPLIEGDDFHSVANKAKMTSGTPLNDADRQAWLTELGQQLRAHAQGAVLTCSALKLKYRQQLRAASPGLRFAFLDITPSEALLRVAARAGEHLFPASLVDSQFAALESPTGETGVLTLDATQPLSLLTADITDWLTEAATQK